MSNDLSTDVQYFYTIGGKTCQMILVQMYSIFRLLIGVPDYSIVMSRMEENKTCRK